MNATILPVTEPEPVTDSYSGGIFQWNVQKDSSTKRGGFCKTRSKYGFPRSKNQKKQALEKSRF
jgi:hypothetical protein